MTRSWFTQLSPPLQSIHRSIQQYRQDPSNKLLLDSLLYELKQHSFEWISQEGVDSGVMDQVLDVASSFSYKQQRVLVNSIVHALLSAISHLPPYITSPLYNYIVKCVEANSSIAKKVSKQIRKSFQLIPSCIMLIVTLFSMTPSFEKILRHLFRSFIKDTQDKKESYKEKKSCRCSTCYGKKRKIYSFRYIHPETEDLFKAWKSAVQHFPPTSSISLFTKMKSLFVSIILSPSTLPLSRFTSRVLLDMYNSLGIVSFVDDIEAFWDSQNSRCCEWMCCVIAHSSILDITSVITVLHEMCITSTWSPFLTHLILHCLYIRLSHPHIPLSEVSKLRLQTIVDCLSLHVEGEDIALVHCVGWLVLNEIPSLPLCCKTWRLHVCNQCCKGETSCAYCNTPVEVTSEGGMGCGWKPPQSFHNCGCGKAHERNQLQQCLCVTGEYPLSFDYSLSSSDDDDDDDESDLVFEMKRIKLEVMEEMKHQPHLGYDEWCGIFSYLQLSEYIQLASVNHRLHAIAQTNGVWKERFLLLFTNYRCNHRHNYIHDYYKMGRRRIKSLRNLKQGEVICQFCGCNRRFEAIEEYKKHILTKHHSL